MFIAVLVSTFQTGNSMEFVESIHFMFRFLCKSSIGLSKFSHML